MNEKLLSIINGSGKLHMVPASVNEKYVIRFCAVAQNANEEDIGKVKKKNFIKIILTQMNEIIFWGKTIYFYIEQ